MRIGSNPAKEREIQTEAYHRVVIPIHIPNLDDDYFKESLKVLELSAESLLSTVHEETRITLVSDASCVEVEKLLERLSATSALIDQVLISRKNIGKVNALLMATKSNTESLFTLADADTLFLPGWQGAVEELFCEFPSAGIVSPVPISGSRTAFSANATTTIIAGLIKRKLGRAEISDQEALRKYWISINPKHADEAEKKDLLILKGRGCDAAVGCGHFVITVRAEVLENAPAGPSRSMALGSSEAEYFDRPNNENGFLRLATLSNFAYHMGNCPETWMYQEAEQIRDSGFQEVPINAESLKPVQRLGIIQMWFGKAINRILKRRGLLYTVFLKSFGINPNGF